MSSASAVIDEARSLLEQSLVEIDKERDQVLRALGELGGRKPRRGPGRPRGSRNSAASSAGTSTTPKRRRRRRGGTRGDQAVKLVEASPGISASEIATEMKIKPNYLYRVLADLEKEGRVRKEGRKYFPESGSSPAPDPSPTPSAESTPEPPATPEPAGTSASAQEITPQY